MHLSINLDWKSFAAIGATVCGFILVRKLDAAAAERVLTGTVNAIKLLVWRIFD